MMPALLVTKAVVADTLLADFNNIESVAELFKNHPDDSGSYY